MSKIEIESFNSIYKSITKYNQDSDFYEHSRETYQCFYDLLNKIDFHNIDVCLFYEIEGFFLITINNLAKSLMLFPSKESFPLISSNLEAYINNINQDEHSPKEKKIKKFILYYPDENTSKEKKKSNDTLKKKYEEFCYLEKNPAPLYQIAIIFACKNDVIDTDDIVKNIDRSILKEGVIIIFSSKGESDYIVNSIKDKTNFKSIQRYTIYPSISFSVDITIMQIQKNEKYSLTIAEANLTVKDLISFKISKMYPNKIKKRLINICEYFMCIYHESAKFKTSVSLSEARGYIFIPLFNLQSKSNKSNKLIQKVSVLNKLTPKEYKAIIKEDNNDDIYSEDFNWFYEIVSPYDKFTTNFSEISNKFLYETAQLSSFSDLNFDARLYTLPDYRTLKEPLDIPVNVKLTSDGIFIYSSSPFYHVVFADYWDVNSFATPIPYMKMERTYKSYRQTVALVLTKGSRQAMSKDYDDNSSEIEYEIEKELDLIFKPPEANNDDADDDDSDNDIKNFNENKGKEEEPQEKEKKDKIKLKQSKNKEKNKEKNKDKDKNKEKSKDKDKNKEKSKDKNKKKDKTDQLNENPENQNQNDTNEQQNTKTEQKKDKNEKPNNEPLENEGNSKFLQFLKSNKTKQLTILDKPLGCISLKFENVVLMMNFVIAVNQAISFSISSQIQKNIEKMVTKLNNDKKPESPKKEDKKLPTVDY